MYKFHVLIGDILHQPNWPIRLGLQNTLTASFQKGKIPQKSVLNMTLNNMTVRFP